MKPILTKEAFIEFCESKPTTEWYPAHEGSACALCQFFQERGLPDVWVDNRFWQPTRFRGPKIALAPEYDAAVQAEPWTFGALAARLRA